MTDTILVLNAGSSSIKFSVFRRIGPDGLERHFNGEVEGIGTALHFVVRDATHKTVLNERPAEPGASHRSAIAIIQRWLDTHRTAASHVIAVGHRVVHGGLGYSGPVRIDAGVIAALERLIPLAPLHQPHHLAAIRAVAETAPGLPQIACFDTAFHRTQPAVAQAFALPRALTEEGVRRYGFHGLSYEYIASALPQVAPEIAHGRVVVAHLGNGASLCAMRNGQSVATTMGMTALDGVPMGTRTGSLDPGVILYLMQQHGMDAEAIQDLLYSRSGLLGVSGISSDMRTLVASDAPAAREAIDLFVYRIGRELGSLAAALGGLDGLVFTAGIGEHAPEIRSAVCAAAAWLGITLDAAANAAGGPRISMPGPGPSAWVVPTDENLMIARHAVAVLDGGSAPHDQRKWHIL
jgi:acetate kinase